MVNAPASVEFVPESHQPWQWSTETSPLASAKQQKEKYKYKSELEKIKNALKKLKLISQI
jgi:hypothetical protein